MNTRGKKGKAILEEKNEVDDEPLDIEVVKSSVLLLKGVTSSGMTSYGTSPLALEGFVVTIVGITWELRSSISTGFDSKGSSLN